MPLVTTKEMFAKAYKGGYAIGAFNVDNVDIMQGVLSGASKAHSPVIIAISGGANTYMHPLTSATRRFPQRKRRKLPFPLHCTSTTAKAWICAKSA